MMSKFDQSKITLEFITKTKTISKQNLLTEMKEGDSGVGD